MKTKYLLGVIVLLVGVIAAMSIMLIMGGDTQPESVSGIVYEPNGETGEEGQTGEALPGIVVPGWSGIQLPSGTTTAEVSLHNPKENAGYYDMQFTLKIKETGEVIFKTGLIRPGEKCSSVELFRTLESGEYDAVLCVQPYTQIDHTETNNAELELKLIVK